MPEKSWYSLTVRIETTLRVRELARDKGLTVDELMNELMRPGSKGVWSTCPPCEVKVKTGNMVNHMARVRARELFREAFKSKRLFGLGMVVLGLNDGARLEQEVSRARI
jgi:hypothetical protein